MSRPLESSTRANAWPSGGRRQRQDSGSAHEDNAPAKLAGGLRTANWLSTAPHQTGGGNEPYAVAGHMRALARTCTSAGPETPKRDGSRSPAAPRRLHVRPRAQSQTGNRGYAPLASASGLVGSGGQLHRRVRGLGPVWSPTVRTSSGAAAAALVSGSPLDGCRARSQASG